VKHLPTSTATSIFVTEGTIDQVVDATRAVFCHVDGPDCLRRSIADTPGRRDVLRELLKKVAVLS
jgi:hypothetical protein